MRDKVVTKIVKSDYTNIISHLFTTIFRARLFEICIFVVFGSDF